MILMYHKVDLNAPTIWWVDQKNFYRQMHELLNRKVVYLDDYNPEDKEQVVITFDGIYENVIKYAIPVLKKFKYPFEVFITGDYLGHNNEFDITEPYAEFAKIQDLQKIIEAGGRLQWHTKIHKNMKQMTEEKEIIQQLSVPDQLKTIDEKSFTWFAYPYGEYNDVVLKYVKKYFKGAVSCNQGNDKDLYVLNRITVKNETSLKSYTISLIVASYNYGKFLSEAIESVLSQTIVPDEILILDDHSTDSTEEVGKHYAEKYPEIIRYYRNDKNLGIVDNFNRGVSLTKGDFICFLGADNRFKEDYIEKTSKCLLEDPKIGIAYTDFMLFGERAKVVYEGFLEERKGPILEDKYYIIQFPEFDKELLEQGNYIHGSSMYRRKAFEQVGGYKNKGNSPEDYNLFHRMVLAGWKAKRVAEPILEYRQHSEEQANIKNIIKAECEFYKNENEELRNVISHRDKDIEILNQEIHIRDSQLEEVKQVVKHRDKDIAELNSAIKHRDKDIAELNSAIDHREKDVNELNVAIDHRDKDIEELKQVLDHRDKDIKELNNVIEQRDKDIKELNNVIIDRDKKISLLNDQIGIYIGKILEENKKIDELTKKYEEIKNNPIKYVCQKVFHKMFNEDR